MEEGNGFFNVRWVVGWNKQIKKMEWLDFGGRKKTKERNPSIDHMELSAIKKANKRD